MDLSYLIFIMISVAMLLVMLLIIIFIILKNKISEVNSYYKDIKESQIKYEGIFNEYKEKSIEGVTNIANINRTIPELKGSLTNLINQTNEAQAKLTKQSTDNLNSLRSDLGGIGSEVGKMFRIFTGSYSKGYAGENILQQYLAKLPGERWLKDMIIDGNKVEFCYKLRNGKLLPIDSKFPATTNLEKIAALENRLNSPAISDFDKEPLIGELRNQRKEVLDAVKKNAATVKKYIMPSLTTQFVILAVPEAVSSIVAGFKPEFSANGVIVLDYGLVLDYLLMVDSLTPDNQDIDREKLIMNLNSIENIAKEIDKTIADKFDKQLTAIRSGCDAIRDRLSEILSHSRY